ncbi:hypothetical protein GGI13_007637, partial [Coemansia sp. RSA 455]
GRVVSGRRSGSIRVPKLPASVSCCALCIAHGQVHGTFQPPRSHAKCGVDAQLPTSKLRVVERAEHGPET